MSEILFAASAFILGGLHALEPGHGKTVVAAYLVGSKGTVGDAFLLGLVVTFTHTISIVILGAGTAVAAAYLVPETVHEALEVVSGLLVLVVGLWMVNERIVKGRTGHSHVHTINGGPVGDHHHDYTYASSHHPHARPETPQPALVVVAHAHGRLTHVHALTAGAEHHHDDLVHYQGEPSSGVAGAFAQPHRHEPAPSSPTIPVRPSLGGLVALGISGGIVPCPAALALLLAAVGANNVLAGLFLVVIFSLGLAAVLVAIGVVLVKAAGYATRAFGGRFGADGALSRRASMASAVLVTLLGAFMTARAILHLAGIEGLG